MRQVNTSPLYEKYPAGEIALIIIGGGIFGSILLSVIPVWREHSVFNHMSPADHLRKAEANLDFPFPTTVRVLLNCKI